LPSGHSWTESTGNQDIVSGGLHGVSAGNATYDTGARIEGGIWLVTANTHSTAASIDFSIILRFVDTSNFLYIRQQQSTLRLFKQVAGVDTQLASVAAAPLANVGYDYLIHLSYGHVLCQLYQYNAATTPPSLSYTQASDTYDPFVTATKAGFGLQSIGAGSDRILGFSVMNLS
jgi:hypothetical protein